MTKIHVVMGVLLLQLGSIATAQLKPNVPGAAIDHTGTTLGTIANRPPAQVDRDRAVVPRAATSDFPSQAALDAAKSVVVYQWPMHTSSTSNTNLLVAEALQKLSDKVALLEKRLAQLESQGAK
jgi:hypothetical protein